MTSRLTCASLLGLSAGLAGCDHATKHLASRELAGEKPVEIVPGLFDLRYTENHDTAFSLTRAWGADAKPVVLAVLATAALLALGLWWWKQRRGTLLVQVGYAFAVGGAVGNVADRIVRGYVIDFLHVEWWPVFNVADIALVMGVGFVMIANRKRFGSDPARVGGPDLDEPK